MGCKCSKADEVDLISSAKQVASVVVDGANQRPDAEEVDQVAKQYPHLVEWAKVSGFRPEHPVAVFPSLSGVQLEVVESSLKPGWVGEPIWLNLAETIQATLLNATTNVGETTRRENEWRHNIMMLMDSDGDGNIRPEEIKEFISTEETLRDNDIVKKVLLKDESNEMTAKELMEELRLVHDKMATSLLMKRGHVTSAALTTKQHIAEFPWAKHMQLHDGWKDPQEGGIKVRPKAGLVPMEYLYGDDGTSRFAESLGLGLMVGVTKKLREMGYEEGKNIRGYGYDWRAPCTRLEERDNHFSNVMEDMEDLVKTNDGKKIVVITHSLGGVCAHYFFHWVAKSPQGQARGGVDWLAKHIHSFVPIAAPTLGAADGSHSFLSGNEGQGLAPSIMSYCDRHVVIRSWLMFGMIFPAGRGLMVQPARSPHWIRRESVLRVHVLTVNKVGADEEMDASDSGGTRYVKLQLHNPKGCKTKTHTLNTSRQYLRTNAAFDDWFQFAWESDQIDGARLKISLMKSLTISALTDTKITEETFTLGNFEDGILSPTQRLVPGRKCDMTLDIGKGFQIDLNLRFMPPNGEFGSELDFRNDDPGAQQCGGTADAFTSKEKRDRLIEQLGEKEGSEWKPEPEKGWLFGGKKKVEQESYTPINVDEFMVMDGMEYEYKNWKECYAGDPIWRECATLAPPIRRVKLVYGINVPTRVGSVFRHKTKRYDRDEPATGLKLDTHCQVDHPGYSITDGIVIEVPGKTPQADDATVDPSKMTFGTRASGDGTVPYWSLKWPLTWRSDNLEVDDPIEVEGVNHREILKTRECREVVFGECMSCPTHYVEFWLDKFVAAEAGVTGNAQVKLTWHGKEFKTEKVSVQSEESNKEMLVYRRRFVFGVTEEDIRSNSAIGFQISGSKSVSGKSEDDPPMKLKIKKILEESGTITSTVKFGTIDLEWRRYWYTANNQGMPAKSNC